VRSDIVADGMASLKKMLSVGPYYQRQLCDLD